MSTDGTALPRTSRLLVVEGDDGLRRLLATMLSDAEWVVQLADDGEQALEAIRTDEPFDLIVLDVQTSFIDPRAFFRRLRRTNFETPVLLLSGHGATSLQREVRADGVLRRPLDQEAIVEQLRTAMADARISDQRRRPSAYLDSLVGRNDVSRRSKDARLTQESAPSLER
jgi:two-component system response regulator MprA